MYAGWIAMIVFGGILFISILALLIYFASDSNNDGLFFSLGCIGMVSLGVIITVLLPVCLYSQLSSKHEYAKYLNTKKSIDLVVSSGNDVYNTAVANSVIEANKWVAEVKSSLEVYGNFSMYYAIRDKEIEFIVINNDDSKNKE